MDDIHNLKTRYRNTRDSGNIRNNFLRPCLKHFKSWKRCTFNFNSSALKSWAGSFVHIINDDVKIEILCDIGKVKDDRDLMLSLEHCKDQSEKEETIRRHREKILLKAFGADSSLDNQDRFKNKYGWALLHYMLATEKLVVKFAVNTISNHYTNSYHEKCGYFTFEDGTVIAHYGSFNESESAHIGNNDSVMVFSSKRPEDDSRREEVMSDVDDDFRGTDSVTVLELSQETLEVIKKNAPSRPPKIDDFPIDDEPDGDIEPPDGTTVDEGEDNNLKLRPYQKDAIEAFERNDFHGILEHATGSGKTFTALNIMRKLYEKNQAFCVIGVPFIPLAEQWQGEIEKFLKGTGVKYRIIECWSDHDDYIQECKFELLELKRGKKPEEAELIIFLVVNNSLEQKFYKLFDHNFNFDKCLFIGDECHRYATKNKLLILPEAKFRLGLSATPIVDINDPSEAEQGLLDYFGGICHTFTLDEAIPDYLCNYYYYPIETYLDKEEFSKWEELYKRASWSDNANEYDLDERGGIFREMGGILSSAENKLKVLNKILPTSSEERKFSIIFTGAGKDKNGERDIDRVQKLLLEKGWTPTRITADESSRQLRADIIEGFKNGYSDGLLAIRVLDEGIDIPEIKNAYIVASSTNRRQFVQRRGRVLRKLEGTEKIAKIYDLVVIPPKRHSDAAQKIIENERKRVDEMSSKALNKADSKKFIEDLLY